MLANHVVINVLSTDGARSEQLAGQGGGAQVAMMDTEWTIDAGGQVPRSSVSASRSACLTALRHVGFADSRLLADALGLSSAAHLPLLAEAGVLGYLGAWWKQSHECDSWERQYCKPWRQQRAGWPLAVLAVYGSLALLIEDAAQRTMLPMGGAASRVVGKGRYRPSD